MSRLFLNESIEEMQGTFAGLRGVIGQAGNDTGIGGSNEGYSSLGAVIIKSNSFQYRFDGSFATYPKRITLSDMILGCSLT